MLGHRLKNGGIPLCPMVLHQRKSLGSPTIDYGVQRRRLHPEIVEHAQHEHSHDRIVNNLHDKNEDCGVLAG